MEVSVSPVSEKKQYKRFAAPVIFVESEIRAAMADIEVGEGMGYSWSLLSELHMGAGAIAVTIAGKLEKLVKTYTDAARLSMEMNQRHAAAGYFIVYGSFDSFTKWLKGKGENYFTSEKLCSLGDVFAEYQNDTGTAVKLKGL